MLRMNNLVDLIRTRFSGASKICTWPTADGHEWQLLADSGRLATVAFSRWLSLTVVGERAPNSGKHERQPSTRGNRSHSGFPLSINA